MTAVTVAEAVAYLDPPISKPTLNRLIRRGRIARSGTRVHCGRPAAEYPLELLAELHAGWVRGAACLHSAAV